MGKKVVSIVLNKFTNDSRVLKENLSLKKNGYEVKILAIHRDDLPKHEKVQDLDVYRLSLDNKKSITEYIDKSSVQKTLFIKAIAFVRRVYVKSKKLLLKVYKKGKKYTIRLYKKAKSIVQKSKKFILKVYRKSKSFIKKKRYLFLRRLSIMLALHRWKLFFLFAKNAKDADIVHCNDLYTLPMGVIVKKIYNKNAKIVYDAHEFETEVAGLSRWKKVVRKVMERVFIRYADRIITVSDSIANEYAKMYGIQKPKLVLNTPVYQEIEKKDLFRERFSIRKDQVIFLYQGGFSKGRGIETLIEAFKSLKDDKSVIVFMGYGVLEDMVKKAAKESDSIYYHEAVSPKILLDYTSSADFGILFNENSCLNHYYCSPNKMFEYLMAEIPVIVSNLYEMKRLVESNKIGVVAKENSAEGLKDAIKEIVKLDRRELEESIKKVKKVYNWEEQEKVLLDIYKELSHEDSDSLGH